MPLPLLPQECNHQRLLPPRDGLQGQNRMPPFLFILLSPQDIQQVIDMASGLHLGLGSCVQEAFPLADVPLSINANRQKEQWWGCPRLLSALFAAHRRTRFRCGWRCAASVR